jgi:hypothetical protein
MGFGRNTIFQALQEPENNQIKVAYQLVVDNKRMILAGKISGQKNCQSFFATSPPSWNSLQVNNRLFTNYYYKFIKIFIFLKESEGKSKNRRRN